MPNKLGLLSLLLLASCSHPVAAGLSVTKDEMLSKSSSDGMEYARCMVDTAAIYASDTKSDSVSAGDIADATGAECEAPARRAENELSAALYAINPAAGLEQADADAHETIARIRTTSRGQAIEAVIAVRRKRSN